MSEEKKPRKTRVEDTPRKPYKRQEFRQYCVKCFKMKTGCKHFICQDCIEVGDRASDIILNIGMGCENDYSKGKYERNKYFEHGRRVYDKMTSYEKKLWDKENKERIYNERRKNKPV